MSEVLVLSDRPVTSVIINIDDSIVEMTDSNASVNCTMTMKEQHEACQIVSMNTRTLSTSTFGLGLLIGMSAWSRREGIIFLHISRNSTINNSFTFFKVVLYGVLLAMVKQVTTHQVKTTLQFA